MAKFAAHSRLVGLPVHMTPARHIAEDLLYWMKKVVPILPSIYYCRTWTRLYGSSPTSRLTVICSIRRTLGLWTKRSCEQIYIDLVPPWWSNAVLCHRTKACSSYATASLVSSFNPQDFSDQWKWECFSKHCKPLYEESQSQYFGLWGWVGWATKTRHGEEQNGVHEAGCLIGKTVSFGRPAGIREKECSHRRYREGKQIKVVEVSTPADSWSPLADAKEIFGVVSDARYPALVGRNIDFCMLAENQ